ncbi:hypothetical protein SKAU_G00401800 [Synaphobranchus kaupii]|uniref:Uncharacterized protein n=1 Tax=Synaphobranchus kaupii TaxID=118154 RepID=A0A9Q1E968_SYNKA|nr:hypothetical protein SKAU_G00401800 [Synaphobranchus kaupii]
MLCRDKREGSGLCACGSEQGTPSDGCRYLDRTSAQTHSPEPRRSSPPRFCGGRDRTGSKFTACASLLLKPVSRGRKFLEVLRVRPHVEPDMLTVPLLHSLPTSVIS